MQSSIKMWVIVEGAPWSGLINLKSCLIFTMSAVRNKGIKSIGDYFIRLSLIETSRGKHVWTYIITRNSFFPHTTTFHAIQVTPSSRCVVTVLERCTSGYVEGYGVGLKEVLVNVIR